MVLGSDRDTTPSSEGLRVCGPAPCSLPCDLPRRAPPSEVARSRSTSHTCHHHAGPRFRAGASGGPGPGEQPWRLPCRVGGQRHLWPEQPGRPRLCLSAGCTKGWWLTEHAGSPPRPGGRAVGYTGSSEPSPRLAGGRPWLPPHLAVLLHRRPRVSGPVSFLQTVVSLDAGPSRRPRLSPTSSSGVCPSRGSRVRTSCNFCGDTDPPQKPLKASATPSTKWGQCRNAQSSREGEAGPPETEQGARCVRGRHVRPLPPVAASDPGAGLCGGLLDPARTSATVPRCVAGLGRDVRPRCGRVRGS